MKSTDRASRSAAVTGAALLFAMLAAPIAAGACDMNAVDQELAGYEPARPQSMTANEAADQRPFMLASPSPDNDEAAKSSSSDKGQSSGNAQGSGGSQGTQQKQ